MSDIEWPVNPAAARQAITAGTVAVPTQTAAQAEQEVRAIIRSATQASTSDLLFFDAESTPSSRIPLSCSGTVCSGIYLGERFDFTFVDAPNLGRGVAEIQAVMVHNGIPLIQMRAKDDQGTANQIDSILYGGWMEYSAFAIDAQASSSQSRIAYRTYAFGNSRNTNPSNRAGLTATWTGVAMGSYYGAGQNWGNAIQGTATIVADFTNSDVDVTFSGLVDLDNPSRSIFDMSWTDLSLSNGAFSRGSGSNQINGRFYGPSHEEVAGTFDRNQIGGAFGAIRGTTP